MTKLSPARSFGAVMKWRLLLLLLAVAVKGYGQDKPIAGIVFDKDSKDRIASVNVKNITTGQTVYNGLTGEFKIDAKAGDVLVFVRNEYHNDTLRVRDTANLAVYMAPLAIRLKEVTIRDSAYTPGQRLAATKSEYSKAYGPLASHDFITNPNSGPAGLGIDALYNAFSRSGRNAAHLREEIDNEYRQNVINFRFNRSYVGKITGLKDQRLTDFMARYRPGYYTATTATDYEFISMIRANLRRFLRNPRTVQLPSLKGHE
jgi:hypothetical protein